LQAELKPGGAALAVRLTFSGVAKDTEQLHQLAQHYQVGVRFYQSDLDYVDGACFGHLICALTGENAAQLLLALDGVKVEELGRV
jgi:ABC-type methionine transport system ATPase subunit